MSESNLATRVRNFIVALAAIVLSVLIVLGLRTQSGTATLATLAETSTPYEVALSNGQPTLLEFYADWCTSCQAMASDLGALKDEYRDRVNFVMLNVDNTKWLPEMAEYEVDGIPHFVFLDRDGRAIAQAIGEQPRSIVAQNLDALVLDRTIPFAKSTGKTSEFQPFVKSNADDPRSHGSQVQSDVQ
ncbi:thioredoxin family protein [Baaleninema simplex]|uniref:thioredoxin family protein n=1 Tax=Baaleninema simplex TaxID=2862350 RepID=UPI000345CC45|nr:thioredoxin family protein [Baaleninema simplex]